MDIVQKTNFNFAGIFGVAAGACVEIAATAPTSFGGIAMVMVIGFAMITFIIAGVASQNALKAYHMLLGSMTLGAIGYDNHWWGLESWGAGIMIFTSFMWGVILTIDMPVPENKVEPITAP